MADIQTIDIRGARVHNLKDINVSVPLHQIVGIAGVSGSGKSSLALGVTLCRRFASLSRFALNLHAAPHDDGVQSDRR